VLRVEGMAKIVEVAPPATEVPEYVEKYRDAIARIGFDPKASPGPSRWRSGSRPRAGRSGSPYSGKGRRLKCYFCPSTCTVADDVFFEDGPNLSRRKPVTPPVLRVAQFLGYPCLSPSTSSSALLS
jgi:hypothetical protein